MTVAGGGDQPTLEPDDRDGPEAPAAGPAPRADDRDAPELSYEQARDELLEVVARLEAGGTTLEEALSLWERGERLAVLCERHLEGARSRLRAVLGPEDGAPD